jgi:cytochrome c oxidase cbb3-type subunit 3
MFNKICKTLLTGAVLLITGSAALAKGGGAPPKDASVYDPFVVTMIIIMIILLLAIGLLANVVLGAAGYYHKREKENEEEKKKASATGIITTIALLFFAAPLFAQDATGTTAAVQIAGDSFGSLSPTAFYFMVGVITVELLVVFVLLYQLRVFLAKEKLKKQSVAATATPKPIVSIWAKMNKFRPVEHESQIDTGHDYDGIRELDNRLPPWWLYGFYISIIFAVVYLWRYHVAQSAPLSHEELQIAMTQAEEQKAAYLKRSASNVDENTVTLLTGAGELADGEKVFKQNCAPCHGKSGEGIVGPNLTDDYWLHGGSIKDVFKTIKYGWPEKGMRSWKDDLSPVQIAQVASYIKSIHGSNPPNAKPQQGELYKEDNNSNTTDSVTTKAVAATGK